MSDAFISSAADFYPPPYTFEDVTSITFPVTPVVSQKLQNICDRFLNGPLEEPGRFVSNLNSVLLTFSSFPEVESKLKPAIGYLSYQEVSFIIMVYDNVKNEVGMFAPILFLDGPQAGSAEYFASWPIALGREVFGLAKTRGEIDFHIADFTGELRSPYPSGLNTPLQLPQIVRVSFPPQVEKTQIVSELLEIEEEISSGQTELLVARKEALLEQLANAKDELREIRSKPRVGARYHPFQLVEKIWGASIANKRLRMKGESREVPEEIRDALKAVQRRSFDPQQVEAAMQLGIEIGFFDALKIKVMRNSPWAAGLGYPLYGLRQLHDPDDFASADHSDIIRSPFEFQTPSESGDTKYLVEFLEPTLAGSLGLNPSYEVLGSDAVVHRNGLACYGDPTKTGRVTPDSV